MDEIDRYALTKSGAVGVGLPSATLEPIEASAFSTAASVMAPTTFRLEACTVTCTDCVRRS